MTQLDRIEQMLQQLLGTNKPPESDTLNVLALQGIEAAKAFNKAQVKRRKQI